jgi:uncharacterized RDD family membrane protein YckC
VSASRYTPGTERAGFVSRAAALVLDTVVVTIMVRGAQWLLEGYERTLGRFAPPVHLGSLLFACAPAVVAIYLIGFWALAGQTPGKWVMGLAVVPLGGGRLTLGRAFMRLVGYLVSALPVYLGFLWVLGPQRRGWHDRLARTEVRYVVRQPQRASTALAFRRRIHGAP